MTIKKELYCDVCKKRIIGGHRSPTLDGKKVLTCTRCATKISLDKTKENSRKRQGFNAISKKVIAARGNSCQKCGDNKNLEVHHIKRIMDGGTNDESNLIVLCHVCHRKEHKNGTWR